MYLYLLLHHFHLLYILYNRYLLGNRMFSPGCWSNRKQLATSEENKRVAVYDIGVPSEQVFIGGYPRLFSPSVLLKKEKLELKRIRALSSGKTVILYCPYKVAVCAIAVNLRLAYSQHIYIGYIQHQNFHFSNSFAISRTAISTVSSLFISISALALYIG